MNRLCLAMFMIMISVSACKKDQEEEQKEEQLPVFGNCEAATPKGGFIQGDADYPFIYRTSGGGTMLINPDLQIILKHDDYENFKIEFWGSVDVPGGVKTSGNHENLNGKHMKDRIGTRRTIIFPDGAKITMVSDGLQGQLLSIDIYDGSGAHHINPTCNTLEYSAINAGISKKLDDLQPDGETSSFEITNTGLLFFNLYNEDEAGKKVDDYYEIGELNRDNPTQVTDYYDDSRLGST